MLIMKKTGIENIETLCIFIFFCKYVTVLKYNVYLKIINNPNLQD